MQDRRQHTFTNPMPTFLNSLTKCLSNNLNRLYPTSNKLLSSNKSCNLKRNPNNRCKSFRNSRRKQLRSSKNNQRLRNNNLPSNSKLTGEGSLLRIVEGQEVLLRRVGDPTGAELKLNKIVKDHMRREVGEAKVAEPTLSITSHLKVVVAEEDNRQEAEEQAIGLTTIKIVVVEVEVALDLLKALAILAGIQPVTLHKTKIQLRISLTDAEVVGVEEVIPRSNKALREGEDAEVLRPLRVLPGATQMLHFRPLTKILQGRLVRNRSRRQLLILGELHSPKRSKSRSVLLLQPHPRKFSLRKIMTKRASK